MKQVSAMKSLQITELNIMLFNVPESEKEDPEEKKKDDLVFLRILMSEIKLTHSWPSPNLTRGNKNWSHGEDAW